MVFVGRGPEESILGTRGVCTLSEKNVQVALTVNKCFTVALTVKIFFTVTHTVNKYFTGTRTVREYFQVHTL